MQTTIQHKPTPDRAGCFDSGACSSSGGLEYNEDAVAVSAAPGGIVAVLADGMGGGEIGGTLGKQAVAVVGEALREAGAGEPHTRLIDVFYLANQCTLNLMQVNPSRFARSGSTLVCALVLLADGMATAHIAHVGDSRAYLLRAGLLQRLTRDHTYAEQLCDQGVALETALATPGARKLVCSLGMPLDLRATPDFYRRLTLAPGDRLLLCSDGVSNVVVEHEMGVLLAGGSARHAARRLVRRARALRTTDNASAVVLSYGPQRRGLQWRPTLVSLLVVWLVVLFVLLLAGCRQPATDMQPATAVVISASTTTPAAAATATVLPATGLAALPADLAIARTALAQGQFAQAAGLLAPFAATDSTAAELLATVYAEWGLATLAAAGGDGGQMRLAYDYFSQALLLLPETDPRYPELTIRLQASAELLSAGDALAALRAAPDAPAAERRARAEAALAHVRAVATVWPACPGRPELQRDILVVAARLQLADAAGAAGALPPASQLCAEALALELPVDPELEHVCTLPATPTAVAATALPVPTAAARPTARPAPTARRFAVVQRSSFDGSGNSGQYASCIDVQVLDQRGAPLPGAVIGINNGQGQSFENMTDGAGYAGRCGLGASTWSIVLFWAPPDATGAGSTTTVYLNGAAEQRAGIVFRAE